MVERNLSLLELDAAEVAQSAVAFDDGDTADRFKGGAGDLCSALGALFGDFFLKSASILPLVLSKFAARRLPAHVLAAFGAFFWSAVVRKQLLAVRSTPLIHPSLYLIRVCLSISARLFPMGGVIGLGLPSRPYALAWFTQIRTKPAMYEELGNNYPLKTLRTLPQFFPCADIEDVSLRLELRVIPWLIWVPDFVASLAIGSQSATAILVRRRAESIERQPLFAVATVFQPEGVIHRGAISQFARILPAQRGGDSYGRADS